MPKSLKLKQINADSPWLEFRNGRYNWDIAHCQNCKATVTVIDIDFTVSNNNLINYSESFQCCAEPHFIWHKSK